MCIYIDHIDASAKFCMVWEQTQWGLSSGCKVKRCGLELKNLVSNYFTVTILASLLCSLLSKDDQVHCLPDPGHNTDCKERITSSAQGWIQDLSFSHKGKVKCLNQGIAFKWEIILRVGHDPCSEVTHFTLPPSSLFISFRYLAFLVYCCPFSPHLSFSINLLNVKHFNQNSITSEYISNLSQRINSSCNRILACLVIMERSVSWLYAKKNISRLSV